MERDFMTSKHVHHEKTLTSESECFCEELIASEDHLAFEILLQSAILMLKDIITIFFH